jgi:hypothetical protein
MFQDVEKKAAVWGRSSKRRNLIKEVMMDCTCCSDDRNKNSIENFDEETSWIAAT